MSIKNGCKLIGLGLVVLVSGFMPISPHKPQDGRSDLEVHAIVSALEKPAGSSYEALETIPITPQDYVRKAASAYGWTGAEWEALYTLLTNESGWKTHAVNKTSGACGLFQAWPCSKLGAPLDDVGNQARWGMKYIKERYGSPTKALSFWRSQCGGSKGCWY